MKKILGLTLMFMLAGVAGNLIGKIGQEPQNSKTKVKKVIVHDTIYVSNSFETYNLPKCEGALIDSLVIDKRKITTDGVPEGGKALIEAFGVGYPVYMKKEIGVGYEI